MGSGSVEPVVIATEEHLDLHGIRSSSAAACLIVHWAEHGAAKRSRTYARWTWRLVLQPEG